MALLKSGKDYAEKFMQLYGIEVKDAEGNKDEEATNSIKEGLSKSYDVLFEYLCNKITEGKIVGPSSVNGPHTSGWFSGATTGKVKLVIK